MKIKNKFENNEIPKKYSKYANEVDKYNANPIVSFPFEVVDVPKEANYLAMTLIDHDAIPVCGFSWIHWTVANVSAELTKIPENFSQDDTHVKVQGKNSFSSGLSDEKDEKIIHRYVGPTPPDKDHHYTLTVYALKEPLNLSEGFYLNEMYGEIESKLISEATLKLVGKN